MGNNMYEKIITLYRDVIKSNFKDVCCELQKQRSFNKKIVLFGLITACYIFKSEKRNREQTIELNKLNREIKRLKNQKG